MSTLDLRPLSIGEILDRTFSLCRRRRRSFRLFPLFLLSQVWPASSCLQWWGSSSISLPIYSLRVQLSTPSQNSISEGRQRSVSLCPGSGVSYCLSSCSLFSILSFSCFRSFCCSSRQFTWRAACACLFLPHSWRISVRLIR